jgi:hypothetical protein
VPRAAHLEPVQCVTPRGPPGFITSLERAPPLVVSIPRATARAALASLRSSGAARRACGSATEREAAPADGGRLGTPALESVAVSAPSAEASDEPSKPPSQNKPVAPGPNGLDGADPDHGEKSYRGSGWLIGKKSSPGRIAALTGGRLCRPYWRGSSASKRATRRAAPRRKSLETWAYPPNEGSDKRKIKDSMG